MPTNRGDNPKDPGRDQNGKFAKGNAGGPGRKPHPESIRQLAERAPDKIAAIIDDKNTPARVKADLLKWCYEIVHGKPKQAVDVDATVTTPESVRFEGVLEKWSR